MTCSQHCQFQLHEEIRKLKAQNEVLKEALKFYARDPRGGPYGEMAREALANLENK